MNEYYDVTMINYNSVDIKILNTCSPMSEIILQPSAYISTFLYKRNIAIKGYLKKKEKNDRGLKIKNLPSNKQPSGLIFFQSMKCNKFLKCECIGTVTFKLRKYRGLTYACVSVVKKKKKSTIRHVRRIQYRILGNRC